MGIYFDHGIEYYIYISDQIKPIILVNIKESNERLKMSDWFNTKKDNWFNSYYESKKIISDVNFDIELTTSEKFKLEMYKILYPDAICNWYDVNVMHSNY